MRLAKERKKTKTFSTLLTTNHDIIDDQAVPFNSTIRFQDPRKTSAIPELDTAEREREKEGSVLQNGTV